MPRAVTNLVKVRNTKNSIPTALTQLFLHADPFCKISFVLYCLVLLQVPKCFGLVQFFCARPKNYSHIVVVTKRRHIFGLAKKIWTGTKHFGTCKGTRHQLFCCVIYQNKNDNNLFQNTCLFPSLK